MAFLSLVVKCVGSLFLPPFMLFILVTIVLASLGTTLGIRRLYVRLLLKLFEYGRQRIEIAEKLKKKQQTNGHVPAVKEEIGPINGIPEGVPQNEEEEAPRKDGVHNPVGNGSVPALTTLISRDNLILTPDPKHNYANSEGDVVKVVGNTSPGDLLTRRRSYETLKREFQLADILDYIKAGMEAIIEDEVTQRFEAEELKSWNLLTRTNRHYEFISYRLTFIWLLGFLIRYGFLLPLRIVICAIGMIFLTLSTAVIGCIPNGWIKRWLNGIAMQISFRILSRAFSAIITYNNVEYRPRSGGICVANHTSPIDIVILACDGSYALIGQRHGGFLGIIQRALARASSHIWFERSEVKDREAVTRRLRQHVEDPNKLPILIFPEGTCINNTSVMQFKKGSFEVGGDIYPVAIKYDPKFGDAFWNSNKYSMMQYLYMMMTSWAIVCEVWYLPPMRQRQGENAIDFANRVKSVIARQGGLVDLMWDGQLKRMKAKKEWKEKQQEEFSKRLKVE